MPSSSNINNLDTPSSLDPTNEEGVYANEREEIVVLSSWCSAPLGSECSRCLAVCPHNALTMQEDGPAISPELFTRCGLCA